MTQFFSFSFFFSIIFWVLQKICVFEVSLLWIMEELAGGGSVAVAVGVITAVAVAAYVKIFLRVWCSAILPDNSNAFVYYFKNLASIQPRA